MIGSTNILYNNPGEYINSFGQASGDIDMQQNNLENLNTLTFKEPNGNIQFRPRYYTSDGEDDSDLSLESSYGNYNYKKLRISDPIKSYHAATKNYVDSITSRKIDASGNQIELVLQSHDPYETTYFLKVNNQVSMFIIYGSTVPYVNLIGDLIESIHMTGTMITYIDIKLTSNFINAKIEITSLNNTVRTDDITMSSV